MSHQSKQQMTNQLKQLTSLCQSCDGENAGTLDKTLVRSVRRHLHLIKIDITSWNMLSAHYVVNLGFVTEQHPHSTVSKEQSSLPQFYKESFRCIILATGRRSITVKLQIQAGSPIEAGCRVPTGAIKDVIARIWMK